ncbi:40S ribosomal protein s30 [Phtheirospermum japonicum]|uniref:40S ribosomal protein s30 n=1 Tax=Phtheirospermum japonicum TaxID=374723 RepID=A0A830BHM5_9LAMI|nr:40S ribosomal protein s30 [Phtheirospermum japonicum]
MIGKIGVARINGAMLKIFSFLVCGHERDDFKRETVGMTKVRTHQSGKVHGSLARAGKVRGQTPKVAKQDKKKKPRGRAHKRMQYNRRFVTAVVGFGKKRGPNSSEK